MTPLIFDLDGTLIDSAPDICAAVSQMLDSQGLPPLDLATVTGFTGNGLPNLVARVINHVGLSMGDHAALTAQMMQRYTEQPATLTQPFDHVTETLRQLQTAGHPMAICTNKALVPTHAVLDALNLSRFFSVVIGGDTLAVNKPDAAPCLAAMAALNTRTALFIGDSEVDAACAHAASVPFVLFTKGYRKTEIPSAVARFSDYADLPALLKTLPKSAP